MRRRLGHILLIVSAVAVLAAAGIAVNLLLLTYADPRSDPVGKLTPRADLTQTPAPGLATITAEEHSETEAEEPDD